MTDHKETTGDNLDAGWAALLEQGRAMIEAEREFHANMRALHCLDCGEGRPRAGSQRCAPCAKAYGEKW